MHAGLEHATIRENIIFGSVFGFDEQRYNRVIEACALEKDLEILDAGDATGMSHHHDASYILMHGQ